MQNPTSSLRVVTGLMVALVGCLAAGTAAASSLPPLKDATLIMRVGQRLSYLAAAATISSGNVTLVPDANGKWVNINTGQTFSESSSPGSGGAGVEVFDICAFTNTLILANQTNYLLNTVTNSVSLSSQTVLQGNGSTLDILWAKPANFAAYPDQTTANFRVKRLNYTVDGRTFKAVRIQSNTGNGWTQSTYDLASGFLIIQSYVTHNGDGSTGLAFFRVTSGKLTGLPGLNTGWGAGLSKYKTYNWLAKGTGGVFGAGGVSGQAAFKWSNMKWTTQVLTADVTVAGKASGKIQYLAGTVGAPWMRSSYLSSLSVNQDIDVEVNLQYRIYVSSIDSTYVSIRFVNKTQSIVYKYRKSTGDLVQYNTTSQEGLFGSAATITFVSRS